MTTKSDFSLRVHPDPVSDVPAAAASNATLSAPEDIFISDDPPPSITPPPASDIPPRVPGPGLPESIGWMIGAYVVQFAVVIPVIIVSMIVVMVERALANRSAPKPNELTQFFSEQLIYVMGLAFVAMLVYALVLVAWRLGPNGIRRLGWRWPGMIHLALIVVGAIPLQIVCSSVAGLVQSQFPDGDWGLEQMLGQLVAAPFPLFVLVIAVLPALAEELLFRGLIGRGLIARWGLWPGILITSVLFGIMHGNPVQGIAVIPMGFAMHFAYLVSRSFWAPVCVHFLNNALAAVMMKYGDNVQLVKTVAGSSELPPQLILAALATVAGIGALMWQSRVRYALADSTEWNPDHPTIVPHPSESLLVAPGAPPPLELWAYNVGTLGVLGSILWQLS